MKLRQKVIFLALTPLILALCAIAFAVRHQAITLAEQQRATIQQAYLASKEAELKHYVTLASHSIASLYQSGRKDDATQEEAKRILSALSYGDDGYFFIYDLQGKSLMHPRQPELVGQNLWELRDAEGNLTIQRLMQRAKSGGGFERYNWIKPSTNKSAPKLGYVILMPEWGWMMGTGIYMDDVDQALAKVDAQQSRNIRSTMELIAAIAILGSLLVAACGLVLNLRELRVVESQEEERARLSRDLHDGISQWLVSIKLQIEAGIARLGGNAEQKDKAPATFERAAEQLNKVLGEVRRISRNLRPAILDDLGLAAALDHLVHEFNDSSSAQASFTASPAAAGEGLPDMVNTVLFRIAQEALTNCERHAHARGVEVSLHEAGKAVELRIQDNGGGFDFDGIALHPQRGIGLRNMTERMEAIGGSLHITSSPAGTVVLARLELSSTLK